MNDIPDTIFYPDNFNNSQWQIECPHCKEIIGFDGIFNWAWTQGCFGKTKITPMDFDGVVERHHHFLIFETKDVGKNIPQGQLLTFEALKTPRTFTVMKIWGKNTPEKMEVNFHNGKIITVSTIDEMKEYVKKWYEWANKNNNA